MKTLKAIGLIFVFLCSPLSKAQTKSYYRNPVIAGDYPDPSVIRVGNTYYSAGTSSEWGAPFRFYKSNDLVNWEYLGSLLKEMPDWTMGSYWAPELFYHDGTYFAYYTARRKSDKKSFIGVASTKDITKGFTDHGLIIEWTNEAIDPFVIELAGKRYITWKAYGLDKGRDIEILGSELSSDGLKLKGKVFNILTVDRNNWEAGGMEGQCLVKHGEYIYMFYAGNSCCGRDCNYQTGVARSKSIKGPWIKYAGNPILHGDDHFRCSGHGTLVETAEHRFFYMYHAYEASTNVFLGRQGMLDEIIWDKTTGWPKFRYGKTPSLQAETPMKNTQQKPVPDFVDNFSNTQLNTRWVWDVSRPKPVTTISDDKLSLQASDTSFGSFLALKAEKSNYKFIVNVDDPKKESVGICIYCTSDRAIGLSISNGNADLWEAKNGTITVLATQTVTAFPISLYLGTQFGQYCQFGLLNGNDFKTIGAVIHISDMTNWDRPPMIGLTAKGSGNAVFNSARLSYSY